MRPLYFLKSMTYTDFKQYCDTIPSNEDDRKNQYKKLQQFCDTHIKTDGETKRIYAFSLNTPAGVGGRLFCGNSIQGSWKIFRGLLMKHTTDIDMKNAHPVILSYLCKKHSIMCPSLDYYIAHRDTILAQFTEMDRDEAKKLFLKSLNTDKMNKNVKNKFFKQFDKEMKTIQQQLSAISDYSAIVASVPASKEYNYLGSAINRIMCTFENNILQCVISSLNKKAIEIAALMFDGLMVYGNFYDQPELLTSIEQHVESQFPGLHMTFTYKPHDDTIQIPEQFSEKVASIEGVTSDMDAAEKLFKLYPHWVNCQDELFVFNKSSGMWENNHTAYLNVIREFTEHLCVVVEKDGEMIKTSKSYGNTLSLMEKIPTLMKTLCTNNNWLKEAQYSSLGKILFNNGYYDFHTCMFYSKEEYGFNPSIVFMGKVHHDFVAPTQDDVEYMEDIRQRLFFNTLGEEVGNYFILNLARGLAGDMMKRILFGLGPSNSGKGVLTTACMLSLGDYVGSFNAENLAYRQTSQDEAQIMRWAMLLRYKRIIFSNEIKSTCELNGNQIKKIASGGDTLIGRNHGQHETEFITHFLPVVLANDLPRIRPYDDAVDTRVRVLNYNKTYVDEPTNQFELKKDDNIKDELKTVKFQQAFVHILIHKYMQYVDSGKVDVEPVDVIQAKKDWVGQEKSCIDQFVDTFEITNNEEHYVKSSDIDEWIAQNKLAITMKKFSMEMKRYCEIKGFGLVETKKKKIEGRAMNCWVGIRKVDEYVPPTTPVFSPSSKF